VLLERLGEIQNGVAGCVESGQQLVDYDQEIGVARPFEAFDDSFVVGLLT
jgi:hypothetical protein